MSIKLYLSYCIKPKSADMQYKAGKQFMLFYLQKIFGISLPFDFAKTTARIFYLTQQLQNITLKYETSYYAQTKLVVEKIIKGVVVEDNSFEKIQFLLQLVNTYFLNRNEKNKFFDQFEIYYDMLIELLEEHPGLDSGASAEAKLVKANKLLQQKGDNCENSSHLLRQVKQDFKRREELQKWLHCELLLAETTIDDWQKEIEIFQELYQKAMQAATAIGLELKGETVAYSQWRIFLRFQKRNVTSQQKTFMLHHLKRAITQSSRSEGEKLFFKMKTAIEQGLTIHEMEIINNYSIRHIDLHQKDLKPFDCHIIAATKWKNLTTLTLNSNPIGDQGCEHLAKASWKNLNTLVLYDNNIGAQGCSHLSKAQWKNLALLTLYSNHIGDEGCAHLIKADWKNLNILFLGNNKIGDQGCSHLIKAEWRSLTMMNLDCNNIGDQGCAYLSKAEWKNLTTLFLEDNRIGDQGCMHLSKAQWKSLTTLILKKNHAEKTTKDSLRKQFNNPNIDIKL